MAHVSSRAFTADGVMLEAGRPPSGGMYGAAATWPMLLFAVPPMIVALVDRWYGARLAPTGRGRRLLRRLSGVYFHTQLIGLLGPVLFTISTNGRRRTTCALFYLVLIGSLYAVGAEWVMRKGVFSVNGADYFSTRSAENTLDYGLYASLRTDDAMNEGAIDPGGRDP